jgi:tetratricopeptide (TPR) repeat protein
VFYSLGEVYLAADDLAGATTWFQKAADADPFWAKPLLRLGEAAIKKGDTAGAARLLARAVDVDPTAPEAATAKSVLASLNK